MYLKQINKPMNLHKHQLH